MKPETLTLRGILAFHEERTLDYRSLPPGLIAFTGPNGVGKTTLMESPIAAEYRQFPSRDKELYDYATRADAFIEHTFELEGRGLFRSRVSIDGPHRKAEAVLSQIGPDGQITFLNDGKLSTFDTAVKDLLPPLDDLLASVFAAQNRKGSFSDLDRRGRRILFASLLGLDRYQQLADRASQAAARLEREIEVLIAQRDVLARSVTESIETSLEQRAQQLQIEAGSVDSARVELTRQIQAAEARLAEVQDAIEAHAKATADVARLETAGTAKTAERQAVTKAQAQLQADHDANLQRIAGLIETARATHERDVAAAPVAHDREVAAIQARLKAAVDESEKRIKANREDLLDQKDAIAAAVIRLAEIDTALAENEGRATGVQALLAGYQRRERVLLDALSAIRERETDLARADKDAAALAAAPFGEDCAPCAFMANAAAAKAQIPGLREAVAAKGATDVELASVRQLIAEAETAGRTLATERVALQKDRTAQKPIADKAAPLALAEARIAQREREIAGAKAAAERERAEAATRLAERLARLQAGYDDRLLECNDEVVRLSAQTEHRREELRQQAIAIVEALDHIEHQVTKAKETASRYQSAAGLAAEQQALLTAYRRNWDETMATRARVEAGLAELARQREAFAVATMQFEAVDTRVDACLVDQAEWTLLAKSLGREGIQTLEIDAAGPTVSAYANDLSEHCAGGRFTFELVTQAPKATKGKDGSTHKEVFDINIYDQKMGGARRDIGDLSGGEKVIAEEILRSAIALLVNAKNQFPMRCAWRDETAGALDAATAERYVAMLRRFQQIGGFHNVFFVSHSEDVKTMADAQVQVADGDFSIALPPFVRHEVAA